VEITESNGSSPISLHLHRNSHHSHANKQSFLASLTQTTKALGDENFLTQGQGVSHLGVKDNGYRPQQILLATKTATRTARTDDKPASNAFIPYTQKTYGRLLLNRTSHTSGKKNLQIPSTGQGSSGLTMSVVYSIQCECGKVCVRQSCRSIQVRISKNTVAI
jgi:hypothetical protein